MISEVSNALKIHRVKHFIIFGLLQSLVADFSLVPFLLQINIVSFVVLSDQFQLRLSSLFFQAKRLIDSDRLLLAL